MWIVGKNKSIHIYCLGCSQHFPTVRCSDHRDHLLLPELLLVWVCTHNWTEKSSARAHPGSSPPPAPLAHLRYSAPPRPEASAHNPGILWQCCEERSWWWVTFLLCTSLHMAHTWNSTAYSEMNAWGFFCIQVFSQRGFPHLNSCVSVQIALLWQISS